MGWLLFDTAIGTCGVAWSHAGLTVFQLPEADHDATTARMLTKAHARGTSSATPETTPAWVTAAIADVTAHLAGQLRDLGNVPLDFTDVPPFNVEILRACRQIPAGRTETYGEVARRVGSPGAARAVGRAMATNPFPIVVPCHRVIAAEPGKGGFSAYGGLVTKEKLLLLEGAAKQQTLF